MKLDLTLILLGICFALMAQFFSACSTYRGMEQDAQAMNRALQYQTNRNWR